MHNSKCTTSILQWMFTDLWFRDLIGAREPRTWWSHDNLVLVILSLPRYISQLIWARGYLFYTYHRHGFLLPIGFGCSLSKISSKHVLPQTTLNIVSYRKETALEISMLSSNSRVLLRAIFWVKKGNKIWQRVNLDCGTITIRLQPNLHGILKPV